MDAVLVKRLLARGETQQVDFKHACSFEGDERPSIGADIIAMANTPGGGQILVGIKNDTRQCMGVTQEQIDSFDPTKIGNYLRDRVAPLPRVHTFVVPVDSVNVLVLQIEEFDDVPLVLTKDLAGSKKLIANVGSLLARTEAAETSPVRSADLMRRILGRAATKRREQLLTEIRQVIAGEPAPEPKESPAAIFDRQLPAWSKQATAIRAKYPSASIWSLRCVPLPVPTTPHEPKPLFNIIRDRSIDFRGWAFPPVDHSPKYHQGHVDQVIDSGQFVEYWAASYLGAFGWVGVNWLDVIPTSNMFQHPPPPARKLDWLSILNQITELFRFASDYADGIEAQQLWVEIRFGNVEGRELGRFDHATGFLPYNKKAADPEIVVAGLFDAGDLMSRWKQIASDVIRHVFTVFQWPELDKKSIAQRQDQLLQRRR